MTTLSRDDLAAMTPQQIAAIDPGDLRAVLSDVAPPVTKEDLAAMTPRQIAATDPAIVRAAMQRTAPPAAPGPDPGDGGGAAAARTHSPRDGLHDPAALAAMTPQQIAAMDPDHLHRSLTVPNGA